jgi:mannose-6-phosphate isomerase-like protein (cupin superfamily)
MNLTLVSEDERRKLYEARKDWKVIKVIEVKENCEIGNHFHRNKDELFIIVKGVVSVVCKKVLNEIKVEEIELSDNMYYVPRNTFHTFYCEAGTLIIGLATELHDDKDDLKLPTINY